MRRLQQRGCKSARWTELFGYYCTSRRAPRIFIRDLLPTLVQASFLSGLPSFCSLHLGPTAAIAAAATAADGGRAGWLGWLVTLAHTPSALPTAAMSWTKHDAACSFLLCKRQPAALHSRPTRRPMPHAACCMPRGAAK